MDEQGQPPPPPPGGLPMNNLGSVALTLTAATPGVEEGRPSSQQGSRSGHSSLRNSISSSADFGIAEPPTTGLYSSQLDFDSSFDTSFQSASSSLAGAGPDYFSPKRNSGADPGAAAGSATAPSGSPGIRSATASSSTSRHKPQVPSVSIGGETYTFAPGALELDTPSTPSKGILSPLFEDGMRMPFGAASTEGGGGTVQNLSPQAVAMAKQLRSGLDNLLSTLAAISAYSNASPSAEFQGEVATALELENIFTPLANQDAGSVMDIRGLSNALVSNLRSRDAMMHVSAVASSSSSAAVVGAPGWPALSHPKPEQPIISPSDNPFLSYVNEEADSVGELSTDFGDAPFDMWNSTNGPPKLSLQTTMTGGPSRAVYHGRAKSESILPSKSPSIFLDPSFAVSDAQRWRGSASSATSSPNLSSVSGSPYVGALDPSNISPNMGTLGDFSLFPPLQPPILGGYTTSGAGHGLNQAFDLSDGLNSALTLDASQQSLFGPDRPDAHQRPRSASSPYGTQRMSISGQGQYLSPTSPSPRSPGRSPSDADSPALSTGSAPFGVGSGLSANQLLDVEGGGFNSGTSTAGTLSPAHSRSRSLQEPSVAGKPSTSPKLAPERTSPNQLSRENSAHKRGRKVRRFHYSDEFARSFIKNDRHVFAVHARASTSKVMVTAEEVTTLSLVMLPITQTTVLGRSVLVSSTDYDVHNETPGSKYHFVDSTNKIWEVTMNEIDHGDGETEIEPHIIPLVLPPSENAAPQRTPSPKKASAAGIVAPDGNVYTFLHFKPGDIVVVPDHKIGDPAWWTVQECPGKHEKQPGAGEWTARYDVDENLPSDPEPRRGSRIAQHFGACPLRVEKGENGWSLAVFARAVKPSETKEKPQGKSRKRAK